MGSWICLSFPPLLFYLYVLFYVDMVEPPMTPNLKISNKVVIFRACKYITLNKSLGGEPAALD